MKKIFVIVALASAVISCKPAAGSDDGDKECNCESPAVVVNGVTETSANVNVDLKGMDSAYYLCVPKSQETPSPSEIEENGVKLEESLFTLSDLEAQTEYVIAVSARCEHDTQNVAFAEFMTLEDEALEMADGFMAYDGLDSASGRYRLSVMMSTKSMSNSEEDYDDVVLYIYLKSDLERIDAYTRKVPFGNITPFYEDGSTLGDMVYYIGKHFTDEDGNPNAAGTAVFKYKGGKVSDILVADDTENSNFAIIDNGDGSYTVKGKIVDKEKGESYSFKYVDDKAVFSLDQTGM